MLFHSRQVCWQFDKAFVSSKSRIFSQISAGKQADKYIFFYLLKCYFSRKTALTVWLGKSLKNRRSCTLRKGSDFSHQICRKVTCFSFHKFLATLMDTSLAWAFVLLESTFKKYISKSETCKNDRKIRLIFTRLSNVKNESSTVHCEQIEVECAGVALTFSK